MIELIALIFIAKEIGRVAALKGLSAGKWKFIAVGSWLLMETIGIFIALMFFERDNLVSIVLVGLGFASSSYFILKNYLSKLPDVYDDDIDNIGTH